MNKPKVALCVLAVCVIVFAPPAMADGLSWTFQRVDEHPSQSVGRVSLAMRTGATWPTVFYDGSQSGSGELDNQLVASSLTPVGWIPTGLGTLSYGYSYMRAKPGHDGRVGVTWLDQYAIRFAQSSPSGWQFSTPGAGYYAGAETAPDCGYLSDDRPVVAYSDNYTVKVAAHDGLTWNTDMVTDEYGYPVQGMFVSMAVDSQDRLGVAYRGQSGVEFAFKSPLSGPWYRATVNEQIDPEHISVAFGPNDEPIIAMVDDGQLAVASYNIEEATWVTDVLSYYLQSPDVNLVFNSEGHPALAYVAGGQVHYRINDGGGWADYAVPIYDPYYQNGIMPRQNSSAALAFDGDDVPLIAYYGNEGLFMAYDPVPEPGSLVLLLAGCICLRRRGRKVSV